MSSPTINFFPYFSPPPPASHWPPPRPPHSVSPPPPPHPHPVAPPPPHVFPPPQPHPVVPPPPPHHVLPPPQPHPFAPPPPHLRPPPPSPLPPSPDHHHPTVIIIVFISCGGLFFLAFMAAALFCCLKKRKKKTVQEAEIIRFDEHRKVKEEIVEGPHGTEAVITVEDDVHIEEKIKKAESVSESSNLGAKVSDHLKHHGHHLERKKSVEETEVIDFDEHRKVKEKIVEGPHGSEVVILSVEDDVNIEEKMKKNETVGESGSLGAKEAAGASS